MSTVVSQLIAAYPACVQGSSQPTRYEPLYDVQEAACACVSAHPSASQYVGSPRAGERRREQERAHSGRRRQAQRYRSPWLTEGPTIGPMGGNRGNGRGGPPTENCAVKIGLPKTLATTYSQVQRQLW